MFIRGFPRALKNYRVSDVVNIKQRRVIVTYSILFAKNTIWGVPCSQIECYCSLVELCLPLCTSGPKADNTIRSEECTL